MSIITILLTTVFSQNSAGGDVLQERVKQGGEVPQVETNVCLNADLFLLFNSQIWPFSS